MRRSSRAATLLVGLVLVGSYAAGSGPHAHAGAAGPGDDLPPARRDAIARLFDPKLRDLGYRTTRASLALRRSYGAPTSGPHLAIYVEPIDPAGLSPRDSVDMIVPLSQLFLPNVFEQWSDLASFDVCQEAATSVDDRPVPPPITQIAVTRKAAKQIDWDDLSLDELVDRAARVGESEEYGLGDSRRLYLYVGPEVADAVAYRRARVAAGLPATVPTTTTSTRLPG